VTRPRRSRLILVPLSKPNFNQPTPHDRADGTTSAPLPPSHATWTAAECADVLSLVEHALNAWACYAKRKIELNELHRLWLEHKRYAALLAAQEGT